MAAPVITKIEFDKPSYMPGEKITVQVFYTAGSAVRTEQFTGTARNTATGETGTLTVTFQTGDTAPVDVTGQDSGNRQWVLDSNTGGIATLHAVA